MRTVLRWGQSAYETDADLAWERRGAEALGLRFVVAPNPRVAPDLRGIDALVVTSKAQVSAPVLRGFTGSLLLTTTSGFDHIDVDAAVTRGVAVGRCPLARRDAVVEHALSAMIALRRRLPALHHRAEAGRWARAELPALAPRRLRDAPVLVVGLGVIGGAMIEALRALGVTVWGVDPRGAPDGVRAVDLDDALPEVGAVTLHCDLSSTSRGMMTAARIARMAPDAVLVNTARGDIVDVEAAVAAVLEGRLRGFAADVFPVEPLPRIEAFAAVPGVWLTPHSSGYSADLGARVAEEVVAALAAWVSGGPLPHPVLAAR